MWYESALVDMRNKTAPVAPRFADVPEETRLVGAPVAIPRRRVNPKN